MKKRSLLFPKMHYPSPDAAPNDGMQRTANRAATDADR